jgi:hypothetical protein
MKVHAVEGPETFGSHSALDLGADGDRRHEVT